MRSETPAGLRLNGRYYRLADLSSGNLLLAGTPFEQATLQFCHEWLSGVQDFTLTTSGSTGTPKTISLKRSAMESSARATIQAIGLQQDFTCLICLDTRYVAGKMMLARAMIAGMDIIAVEPSANPFAGVDADTQIDFAAIVPYQLNEILASPSARKKFNNLKSVLIGGAEINDAAKVALQDLAVACYATYGMTETISHIALQKLNLGKEDFFTTLPGIRISKDDRGCLTIAAAYLGAADIITNDLVDLISPNQFRWLGRWDNIINTGGVKVIPEKIEKTVGEYFARHAIQQAFFIAGVSDDRLGKKVTLIIEGAPLKNADDLIAELAPLLTRFELPREILYAEKFSRTDTGKIARKQTLDFLNV